MITNPIHQFEIRFTHLLEFPRKVLPLVSPFLQLTSNIRIENEDLLTGRIHLMFEDRHDTISILWDRIIYKSESHKDDLFKKNSFIEEPFLNLFRKIEKLDGFGEIKNVLFYSVHTNHEKGVDFEKAKINFQKKYLKEEASKILDNITDAGLLLDNHDDKSQLNLRVGPYVGIADIEKLGKNFKIREPETLAKISNPGEIFVVTLMEKVNAINFNQYIKMHKKVKNIVDNYWKK